jgi:HSP20 family protein
MSIVNWDPFRELEEMSNRLNRLVSRSLPVREGGKDALTVFDWAPSVDIAETAEEYQIKAELPELRKEDIKVSVENNTLRIEGERRQEKEEKGKKWHRVERSYGSFLRTFTLPENADGAKMSAEYKNGVLNVHLPKAAKAAPKTIEVKGT